MSKFLYPAITLGLAAFVSYSGYCVYRHSRQQLNVKRTPSCKYSLFESRLMEILRKEVKGKKSYPQISGLETPAARRDFFMRQVQAANEYIDDGEHDAGIDLLIVAMAVCSRPAVLLQCMSNSLPRGVYRKLLEKLSNLT